MICSDYEGVLGKLNQEFVRKYNPLSYNCERTRDGTKITVSTYQNYMDLQKILDKKDPYRCIQDINTRPFKIAIKNNDTTVQKQPIKEDLESKGFDALRICPMYSFKARKVLPMFLVDLIHEPKSNEALNITELCHYKVTVELYRARKVPAQCSNCQRHYHTAGRCKAQPACRYCSGTHYVKNCQVSNDPYSKKCALCSGPHTAHYRGCPILKEIMDKINLKFRPSHNNNNNNNVNIKL